MTTLVSRPYEVGWVRLMRATDEHLDAYLTPPPDRNPEPQAPAFRPSRRRLNDQDTRNPTRAARARRGGRRKPIPRGVSAR